MSDLDAVVWPLSRLGEALEALARRGGLGPRQVELPAVPSGVSAVPDAVLEGWVLDGAEWLGLEAEPVSAPYGEVGGLLRGAGPALLRLTGDGPLRLLLLLGSERATARVLGPDHRVRRVPLEALRAALCDALEAPLRADLEALLASAGVPPRKRSRATAEILRQRLGSWPVRGCWLLRVPPGEGFLTQARHAGLPGRLRALVIAHLGQYALGLVAWVILGRGALQGRFDLGWLAAWALLLLTAVPVRMLESWTSGLLAVDLGALMKQRLLVGALRLEPEEVRHQGAGQLLGRVIESEALEALALSSGFVALAAALELVVAGGVLALGAGAWLGAGLLAGWTAVSVALGATHYLRARDWSDHRLALTHDLVERMVGHRTRLAQESPERWHDGEDQSVARYLERSSSMDRVVVVLTAAVPRGWLLAGLAGLAPAFASGSAGPGVMAVGIGGVLLAHGALRKLVTGLASLSGAAIAWRQVKPLFHAAPRRERAGAPTFALPAPEGTTREAGAVLEAHDVVFRYRPQGDAVLRGATVRILEGERLLLEGGSGGGKSTLGSVLAGLRVPESGLLLLRGLDRQTLGAEGWRRRVVSAPQFHENHVFSETLAFNLLMGGTWPPSSEALEEAERVCRELDLGPLLERMPSGLQQMVGETGWQLSHGERSRVFIARALLQGADLVVLDESFAALDPETLHRCLKCVLARASTVLVIAHP